MYPLGHLRISSQARPKGYAKRYGLPLAGASVLRVAILAVIAGAQGWEDIELYAQSHQTWLEELLDLRNGVPHADTYRRVFALINPQLLQKCFLGWIKQIAIADSRRGHRH